MIALLLALQVALPAHGGSAPPRAPADPALWVQIDSLTRAFLLEWRTAWGETQRDWPYGVTPELYVGNDVRSGQLRLDAVHCHFTETPRQLRRRMIRNSRSAQASCPTWYPPGLPALEDERLGVDGGLERRLRPRIMAQRTALRAFLMQAAASMPDDVRLTGQRVRFALDAGALRDAWALAASCTADASECGLLRGLVLHRGGYIELADSTFLAAAASMTGEQRCAWNDVRVLLEPESRERYGRMDCAERADVEARLWWLADPLFLEPGNERRAEHFARRTLITLLAPLGGDGRLRFLPHKGGEAVMETLVRYGWASQYYWAGPFVDRAHDAWLVPEPGSRTRARADTAPPYVVPEYTPDRLHTVPRFTAVLAPFEAAPDDWQLNAPGDPFDWWPVEHFARDRSAIRQLPAGQSATLRRRDAARFLWAGDLEPGLFERTRGDTVRATLFASHAVGAVRSAGTFAGPVGNPIVVDVPLQAGPVLIGIELPGDSVRPAARTRFGTSIPEPLSALGGAQALSPPILFEPPDGSRVSDRQAVARMYGSTSFSRRSRVGVYWEGYGFAVNDTVEVELRVERQDRPGLVGRAVAVLGVGEARQADGALRWSDMPGADRAIQVQEGDVPVQMRNVTIDLSGLARGSYRLTISMRTRHRPAVSSERMFELR
jgi:hypothetical protein